MKLSRRNCTCEAWPFPHRHGHICKELERVRQEEEDNDPEDWVDGTAKDVINWMREEVGRG